MGYTTEFWGEVKVEPLLNEAERDYLTRFASSRRMHRRSGPYTASTEPDGHGQDHSDDVIGYNATALGQPGLWCHWVPNKDGTAICWDQAEKFYSAPEWMEYLIEHFLRAGARVQQMRRAGTQDVAGDPAFESFTFDHVLNGAIDAQGEDHDDRWRLVVKDNVVAVQAAVANS